MTKSSKSKQKKKSAVESPTARGSRLLRILLLVTTLIVVVICAGGPFANGRADGQLRRRDLARAEWWLNVGQSFPLERAENEFLWARLARKRGDTRDMLDHLRRADELGYASIDVQRERWLAFAQAGQMDEAESHLAALLMDPRDDGAEILEAYTQGYLKVFRQNDALTFLEKWIANFPDDAEPLYLRGHLWRDLVRWNDAEDDLRQAVARDPRHYGARLGLGNILIMNKKPEEALEHFVIAEGGDAQRLAAKVGQAKCHINLGAADKARQLLSEVLAVEPGHVDANLEMARIALVEMDNELANQLLDPLVAKHPKNYDLRQVYSTTLRRVGQSKKADQESDIVAAARKALQHANDLSLSLQKKEQEGNVDTRYEIGMIHLKYSSDEEGLIWLYGVLYYDPDHKPTHEALANYFETKNRTLSNQKNAEHHRKLAQKDES